MRFCLSIICCGLFSACGFKPQAYAPSTVALTISGLQDKSELLQCLNRQSQARSILRQAPKSLGLKLHASEPTNINLARANNDQIALEELELKVEVKLIDSINKICKQTNLSSFHITERLGASNMQSELKRTRLQSLLNQQMASDILDYWQNNVATCT